MKRQELDKLLMEYELAQENHHHYDTLQQAVTSFLLGATLAALWLSFQLPDTIARPVYVLILAIFSLSVAALWRLHGYRLGFFRIASLEKCWHVERQLFGVTQEALNAFSKEVKEEISRRAKGERQKDYDVGRKIPLHNYIMKKDDSMCLQERGLKGRWFAHFILILIGLLWVARFYILVAHGL